MSFMSPLAHFALHLVPSPYLRKDEVSKNLKKEN